MQSSKLSGKDLKGSRLSYKKNFIKSLKCYSKLSQHHIQIVARCEKHYYEIIRIRKWIWYKVGFFSFCESDNKHYKQEEFVETKNNRLEKGLRSFLNIMDVTEMLNIGVFVPSFMVCGWLRKHVICICWEFFKSWNGSQ